MKQVDLVVRDLGERGKFDEGIPPALAARSLEPAPMRASASAPVPAPVPAPAPAPISHDSGSGAVTAPSALTARRTATGAVPTTPDHSAFSPSMQLAQVSTPAQRSADDASLIGVMLEQQKLMLGREEKLRQEMRQQSKEMEAKTAALALAVSELTLRESALREQAAAAALRGQLLLALQSRLEGIRAAKLLGDEELFAIEDIIADGGTGAAEDGQVAALVSLSGRMAADAAFARQLRRKYA